MITGMPDICVDVDLRNPGQFFACCGLLELASRIWTGSEGWFSKEGKESFFSIATHSGHNDPLGEIVRRVCEPTELVALADDHEAYAQKDRKPVVLLPFKIRIDWWLNSYRGEDKSELKMWAGQQKPDEKLKELRIAWQNHIRKSHADLNVRSLLSQVAAVAGLGFDPQSAWKSIDIGFSPDEQDISVLSSPSVEILAAIGLQRCRPLPVNNKRRWFAYAAWCDPVEIAVAPAALAGAGRSIAAFEFPVVMRNSQYGSFGWAKVREIAQ